MKPEEMKTLSEHLRDAIYKEDLTIRQAAEYLGLNPGYVSMAKNPKTWDGMSKDAWHRLTFWHNSRCKLSEYNPPEDAEVYRPKEKADKKPEQKETLSPTPKQKRKYTRRKPKESKPEKPETIYESNNEAVKFQFNRAEIEGLKLQINEIIERKESQIKELTTHLNILETETIAVMKQRIDDLEKALKQPKEFELKHTMDGEKLKQIVIFQRNNYPK